MKSGTVIAWILRIVDAGFVVAVAFLCWALVWCDGPFERVSWLGVLAFIAGIPLLLFAAVYFGICRVPQREWRLEVLRRYRRGRDYVSALKWPAMMIIVWRSLIGKRAAKKRRSSSQHWLGE